MGILYCYCWIDCVSSHDQMVSGSCPLTLLFNPPFFHQFGKATLECSLIEGEASTWAMSWKDAPPGNAATAASTASTSLVSTRRLAIATSSRNRSASRRPPMRRDLAFCPTLRQNLFIGRGHDGQESRDIYFASRHPPFMALALSPHASRHKICRDACRIAQLLHRARLVYAMFHVKHCSVQYASRGELRYRYTTAPGYCACAMLDALRRWASSSSSAAGVMPSMRAAWARVAGRRASSFWRTSVERPATAA